MSAAMRPAKGKAAIADANLIDHSNNGRGFPETNVLKSAAVYKCKAESPDMSHSPTQPQSPVLRGLAGLVAGIAALAAGVLLWAWIAPVAFWAMFTPEAQGVQLTVAQAHEQAVSGQILLVDIRRPDEWRGTGIGQGATPLDMRRPDFIPALKELTGGDTARPVALICARGVRSAKMSGRLRDAGFSAIIDVPEGMIGSRAGPGWIASGLPVEKWRADPE